MADNYENLHVTPSIPGVHICDKVGEIASIKVVQEDLGHADKRIEDALNKLTEKVEANQKETQDEFKQIATTLATIQTNMKSQSDAIADLRGEVKAYSDSLNSLHSRVGTVENTVNINTDDIKDLKKDKKKIDDRLSKIEKYMIYFIAIITIIVGGIEILSNIGNIRAAFFSSDNTTSQTTNISVQEK